MRRLFRKDIFLLMGKVLSCPPLAPKKIGHFPVGLSVKELIASQDTTLEACFSKITEFGQGEDTPKAIWYKINVIDQAINDYVDIGFLNLQSSWPELVSALLDVDRADQSGDVIIAILDIGFKWAVRITLSQDTKQLRVDLYKKY